MNKNNRMLKRRIMVKYILFVSMIISVVLLFFTLAESMIWTILMIERVNKLGFIALAWFIINLMLLILQEQNEPFKKMKIDQKINDLTDIIIAELHKEKKSKIYISELCDLYANYLAQIQWRLGNSYIGGNEEIIDAMVELRRMFTLYSWQLADEQPQQLELLLQQVKYLKVDRNTDNLKKTIADIKQIKIEKSRKRVFYIPEKLRIAINILIVVIIIILLKSGHATIIEWLAIFLATPSFLQLMNNYLKKFNRQG